MKTANIPAEIVRAKVLESFGRRIAAVCILVMSVSIVAPCIAMKGTRLCCQGVSFLWRESC